MNPLHAAYERNQLERQKQFLETDRIIKSMSTDTPAPSALPADSSEHISIGAFPEMFNPMCECESCGRERKRLFDKHIGPLPSPDKSAGGTPRTDVEVFYRDSQPVVEAGFARTLERENADLRFQVKMAKGEVSEVIEEIYKAATERDKAMAQLAQAQQSLAEAREKENGLRKDRLSLSTQLQDITDQFFARSQELAGLDKDYGVLEQQYSDTCVQLAQLKQERDELVGEMQTLTKRLEWVNEPLKGNETAEYIKKLYHRALLNHVHDESEIKEMVRPYLTEFELEGDSYGVPDFVDWVRLTVARLASPASSPTQGAEHGETLTHPPAGA